MITKQQKQEINNIAKKHNLKMLLLFGSRANGRNKKDSDFDIAYLPEKSLLLEQKLELNNELSDVFGSDKIDQIDIRKAYPLLLHQISKNCQLLFGKNIDFIKFKTRAFRIFIDSASLFRLQDKLIRKRHQALAQKIYA